MRSIFKKTDREDKIMIIQAMNSTHTEGVAHIEQDCFSEPWSLASIDAELHNSNAVYYVAAENGNVIGYAGAHIILGEAYVTNIAVDKAFRGQGIGSLLMSALIKRCKSENCAFTTLEVRTSNTAAISLYNRFGFKTVGMRKKFYSKPTEDAYIMTLYF